MSDEFGKLVKMIKTVKTVSDPPKLTEEDIKKILGESEKNRVYYDLRYPRHQRTWRWNKWADVVFEAIWTRDKNCNGLYDSCVVLENFGRCIYAAALEEQRVQMAEKRCKDGRTP